MDATELLNMVVKVEVYAIMVYAIYRCIRFLGVAVSSVL